MTGDEARSVERILAHLQTEINRLDRLAAATLQVGSAEDLQVLRLLLGSGPMRVGEIAATRCSSVANISARLDRLERRGLVVRERPPGDRRAVVAVLSDEGKAAAERSRCERLAALEELDADFPIERLQSLVDTLADLTPAG